MQSYTTWSFVSRCFYLASLLWEPPFLLQSSPHWFCVLAHSFYSLRDWGISQGPGALWNEGYCPPEEFLSIHELLWKAWISCHWFVNLKAKCLDENQQMWKITERRPHSCQGGSWDVVWQVALHLQDGAELETWLPSWAYGRLSPCLVPWNAWFFSVEDYILFSFLHLFSFYMFVDYLIRNIKIYSWKAKNNQAQRLKIF